jgi:hypothetical protein
MVRRLTILILICEVIHDAIQLADGGTTPLPKKPIFRRLFYFRNYFRFLPTVQIAFFFLSYFLYSKVTDFSFTFIY